MAIKQPIKRRRTGSALAASAFVAGFLTLSTTFAQAQAIGGGSTGRTSFSIDQSRPRLVLLLHGVTPKPVEDEEAKIGSSTHARYYWGFNFIQGLLGAPSELAMRVVTPRTDGMLHIGTTFREDWHHQVHISNTRELAPICYPISWNKNLPTGIETTQNQQQIRQFVRNMTNSSSDTMVMVNTRDGSKHLIPQLSEAIHEIYDSYVAAYGHLLPAKQPQIYIVGHSFGGVIARALLANPTGPDLFGNRLTEQERQRADYLRSRVVLVHTLSTPHEGSHLPDLAGDVADFIDNGTNKSIISAFFTAYAALPWKNKSSQWVKDKTREAVEGALNAVSGRRDCLKDLLRMPEYNRGILHPSTAKRPNGDLVPIYTAAGRNPGNTYYDRSRSIFFLGGSEWNPYSTLDYMLDGNRHSKEAMALVLIEAVMRQKGYGKEPKFPWGKATLADGDRIKSPMGQQGTTAPRKLSDPLNLTALDLPYITTVFKEGRPFTSGSDGEWDNDGFVGFDSSHALNLTGANWYRIYSKSHYSPALPWDIDNHGSLMFNPGNGLWIHNELVRQAGPFNHFPGSRRSTWSMFDEPEKPRHGIKLEMIELADKNNDLDFFTKADLTVRTTIGGVTHTFNAPDDTNPVKNIPAYTLTNYASPVIPIMVDVFERDLPWDPNDQCVLSQRYGQSTMFIYFDSRTGRIVGDFTGQAGEIITAQPYNNSSNQVRLKFRITKIQ